MASLVFFRAANVGGHRLFKPTTLARELSHLGVESVGAAGTFLVRKAVKEPALRAEILGRLPFQPELLICPAAQLLALVREEPFRDIQVGSGLRPFFSLLNDRPERGPRLPFDRPEVGPWEVRLVALKGRFVLSLRDPAGAKGFYPNEVVEKAYGLPATTRNWSTVLTLCAKL